MRWIITECRTLTEAELASIRGCKVITTPYGRAMEFELINEEESSKIPLDMDFELVPLSSIRILTLRKIGEGPIYRVASKDYEVEDFEEYVRKEELKHKLAKLSGNFFACLTEY